MPSATGARPPVVLVTGASSGIGKACAERLFARGCRVYGTSRQAPRALAQVRTSDLAPMLRMIPLDVTSDASVDAAVGVVVACEGRIDAVVNNAGFGVAGAAELTTIEEAREQFETNFFGTVRVCRAVLPVMRQQGSGRILNVSSIAGRIGIPFQAFYSASKFAIEGFSEALRMEVAPFGVKVVLIEPGDFRTGFTAARRLARGASGQPDAAPKGDGLRTDGSAGLAAPKGDGLRTDGSPGLAAPKGDGLRTDGSPGLAAPKGDGLRTDGSAGLAAPKGDGLRTDGSPGLAAPKGDGLRTDGSPYATRQAKALAVMEHDEKHGATPEAVARLVHRVITTRSPGVRYAVGPAFEKLTLVLVRWLPSRLFAWGIGKYYRV
jgi:NAD(P)-dependent dehydrogenase (short-subunit alcohol dehydrogenase family)